jgi:hypothetical protein
MIALGIVSVIALTFFILALVYIQRDEKTDLYVNKRAAIPKMLIFVLIALLFSTVGLGILLRTMPQRSLYVLLMMVFLTTGFSASAFSAVMLSK